MEGNRRKARTIRLGATGFLLWMEKIYIYNNRFLYPLALDRKWMKKKSEKYIEEENKKKVLKRNMSDTCNIFNVMLFEFDSVWIQIYS